MTGPALEIDGLRTEFQIGPRWYAAVDDLSLSIAEGETLALVGESGCGKSMTSLSIMRLVPEPAGRIAAEPVSKLSRSKVKVRPAGASPAR